MIGGRQYVADETLIVPLGRRDDPWNVSTGKRRKRKKERKKEREKERKRERKRIPAHRNNSAPNRNRPQKVEISTKKKTTITNTSRRVTNRNTPRKGKKRDFFFKKKKIKRPKNSLPPR